MNEELSVSTKLVEMLKDFEGLARQRSDGMIEAYLDTNTKPNLWTVCWGHTGTAKPGLVVSRKRCVELKKMDLRRHEESVRSAVTVPLTQGQFDALVSFSYNVGAGKFEKSDVVAKINAGDMEGAKAALLKRNRAAGGKVLPGLVKRRKAEVALMDDQTPETPSEPLTLSNRAYQQVMEDPASLWAKTRSLFNV